MKKAVPFLVVVGLLIPVCAFAAGDNPARAFEQKLVKARPLPLNSVRLTGGPLKRAQDLELDYLLQLEPDRMLAYLRRSAKLEPKAKGYSGWDGDGRQLTGHIAGHYLSAVSLAWAATGDVQFKERADYLVSELKLIQDAQSDGYIGALMDKDNNPGKVHFQELSKGVIKSGGFDLNGLWSPWYVEHKIFAGLRDAYHYTGNRTALDVETRFAGWVEGVLAPLNDDQIQKMLNTEFGGMNEVLADLYADTSDPRWLKLAGKFHHRAIVDPLAAHHDVLPGNHANTQIPKLYGALKLYLYTGNETEGNAAKYFWDEVALHHSFATGGNSKNEYFSKPDQLNDMVEGRTAETCNVYNMLKMTRTLFSIDPDIRYADFHERALFNHILASQDPDDGRVSYMLPVGRGVQHEYQNKFEDFTCCVGTAMESHALHGYGIYFESGDKLWVSLYAPSTVAWSDHGVKLIVNTDFPIGESVSVKIESISPRKFTLALRRPYWAGNGFTVKLNGQEIKSVSKPDSYIEIARTWKTGDTVELTLPKTLRKEPLPDNPHRFALMWGPLALAGDVGPEIDLDHLEGVSEKPSLPEVPVFVAENQSIENWLKPVPGMPGHFRTAGVGLAHDIDFVPFYQLPRRRYAIYWDMYAPVEWKKIAAGYAAEEDKKKKLEAATVAFAQPGQMQTERDFNQQGEDSSPLQVEGRFGRQGTKWFSFDLPVDPAHPMALVVTYSNDARRRTSCDVLVDKKRVGGEVVERRSPEQDIRFMDVEYAIPADLLKDKARITVRFEARGEDPIPAVFGLRIVRADAAR